MIKGERYIKDKAIPMRTLVLVAILFYGIRPLVQAQKEASQYFYWRESGIKFNEQGIETYTNTNNISNIQTSKDFSPVLCDRDGNLLLYTNMETIYDRSGKVMENGEGLLANRNGIQGAVWVELPASRGRYYYLFYSDAKGTQFGNFPHDSIVSYALVDMQGNGGLGKVVQKNVFLHGGSSGYIAAVRHKNDVDTWVMTYHFHRKEFMAYLVSSCGITGPVISKDNIAKELSLIDPPPQLRFSPQGDKLACLHATATNGGNGVVGIWNFDNENGTLSYKYGIEGVSINYFFSPSGQFVYTCNQWLQGLVQYDVTEPDSANCYASRYEISPMNTSGHTGPSSDFAAHLYGQDGSIYLPMIPGMPAVWLTRITYPNLKGAYAQFDTIDKNSRIGYNLFIHDHMYSYYRPGYHTPVYDIGEVGIPNVYFCAGVSGIVRPASSIQGDSAVWIFGDGTRQSVRGILNQDVFHTYAQAGNYEVELIRYFKCATDTARKVIEVKAKPYLPPLQDTIRYCGEPITISLDGLVGALDIEWNTGLRTGRFTTTQLGWHVVRMRFDCGFLQDSIYIQDMQLELPNLVTQNGDGQNDVFKIKKAGEEAGVMEVYNSWGSLVFTSKDYQNNWPEEEQADGLYYYQYTINTCTRKGWIQVVK